MKPLIIFGIKNCDTMQKAFKWLDAKKISYEFHDYKKSGITEAEILKWMKKLSIDEIINKRGTTWKNYSDAEKAGISDPKKAIELIIKNPSVVKRPLLQHGSEYLLGFQEEEWSAALL